MSVQFIITTLKNRLEKMIKVMHCFYKTLVITHDELTFSACGETTGN